MSLSAGTAKAAVASGGTAAAAVTLIPADWPGLIAIAIGVMVGTAAAWAWEDQEGRPTGWRWFRWQVAMWGLVYVSVLGLQETFGWSVRASIAIAAAAVFLGREGLSRIRRRILARIEDEKELRGEIRQTAQVDLSRKRLLGESDEPEDPRKF
jgi:hypothetical protein